MSASQSGDDRNHDELSPVDDDELSLAQVEPEVGNEEASDDERGLAPDEPPETGDELAQSSDEPLPEHEEPSPVDDPWLVDEERWPSDQLRTVNDRARSSVTTRRLSLPWSDRSILIVSVIAVLVITPLWLDPLTLAEMVGMQTPPATQGSGVELESPASDPQASEPPPAEDARTVARDTFARTLADGWGSADLGGAYATAGDGSLSVDGSTGVVVVGAGLQGAVQLPGVVATDSSIEFSVATDRLPARGELVTYGLLRAAGDDNAYRFAVHVTADGSVYCGAEALVNGRARRLGGYVAIDSGATGAAPSFNIRAEAQGVDPTALRVRVWRAGASEPTGWDVSIIDWAGPLQRPGSAGVAWQLGATRSNDITLRFADLTIESQGDTN